MTSLDSCLVMGICPISTSLDWDSVWATKHSHHLPETFEPSPQLLRFKSCCWTHLLYFCFLIFFPVFVIISEPGKGMTGSLKQSLKSLHTNVLKWKHSIVFPTQTLVENIIVFIRRKLAQDPSPVS